MFKLAPIEEAYNKLTYGYDEPDEIRMNQDMAEELAAMFEMDGVPLHFNDALVVVDPKIPPGTVELRNTKWMVKDSTADKRHSIVRIVPPRC